MARVEPAQGKYPPAKALAASNIRTQSAETTTMGDLLRLISWARALVSLNHGLLSAHGCR